MPSTLKRTQRKALTLTRSFTDAIKARISTSLFQSKRSPCAPSIFVNRPSHDIPQPSPNTFVQQPSHSYDSVAEISRPRPLHKARRGLSPTAHPYAHHPYRIHFIHQLPYELLAHIFVLGSEDDTMLPVQVSLVCRTWRQIALRTPALWRKISLGRTPRVREVVGPFTTERQWEAEWEMWTERIRRARACTLDVHLTGSGVHSHGYNQQRHPVDADVISWRMHIVTPYISRWRSLSINFTSPAPYLWNAALSSCCGTSGSAFRSRRSAVAATSLEELSLVYRHNDDNKTFLLFSGSAPRLRRVTLDGIRLTWLSSLFGNLTYLDWTHHAFSDGDNAADEVLSMLEVSSRLVELRLLFPEKRTEAPVLARTRRSRTVALPYLRRMQLRVEGRDIPYELVKTVTQIVTPQLRQLHLVDVLRTPYFRSTPNYPPVSPYIHIQSDTAPFPSLKSFFYVYSLPHTLQELRVEGAWYDPGMIPALIGSAFRELRRIVISGRRGEQVLEVGASSVPQKRPTSRKQRVGRQVGVMNGGSQGKMSMHMHVRQNSMWIQGR